MMIFIFLLVEVETESENWNFLKYGRIGEHPNVQGTTIPCDINVPL